MTEGAAEAKAQQKEQELRPHALTPAPLQPASPARLRLAAPFELVRAQLPRASAALRAACSLVLKKSAPAPFGPAPLRAARAAEPFQATARTVVQTQVPESRMLFLTASAEFR